MMFYDVIFQLKQMDMSDPIKIKPNLLVLNVGNEGMIHNH